MLELCNFFKERKEMMWNLNDSSELEEEPHRRRMTRVSSTQYTEERTTKSRRPTKAYNESTSSSLEKDEGNVGYAQRSYDSRFPMFEPPMVMYKKQNSDTSSDEEFCALPENNNARARAKDSKKAINGQTNKLYTSTCHEVNPALREERRICRKESGQQRGKDRSYSLSNQDQTSLRSG